MHKSMLVILLGFFCAALSIGASAQDDNAANDVVALEEVVVTATRKQRNLQEVPISVTALSGDFLRDRQLVNFEEIVTQTPGLNLTSATRTLTQPVIRGGSSDDDAPGVDLAVGLFVDDVFLGRNVDFSFDLFDIERVEVLKGPQGTLFGRNVTGGVINVVTKNPEDEFLGRVEVVVGSDSRFDFRGMLNVPIVDNKLAARFAVSTRNAGGTIDNLSGPKLDQEDQQSFRGKLVWHANDDVHVLIGTNYLRDRSFGIPRDIVNLSENLLPALAATFNPAKDITNIDAAGEYDRTVWGLSGKVHWHTGFGDLDIITAWYDNESDISDIDVDGTPELILGGPGTNDVEQFSQEIRHSYTSQDGRFDWIGGLYYLDIDYSRTEYVNQIPFPGSFLYIIGVPPIGGSHGPPGAFAQTINTKSYAVFGQLTYSPVGVDGLSFTLGGRFTKDEKSGTTSDTGVIEEFDINVSDSWDAFTPKFGVNYAFNDDVMMYLSATKGFKSGGFSATTDAASAATPFNEEFVWSYEAGLKSRLLEDRLQANVAVFFADYTDLQFREGTVGTASFVGNAGAAELFGIELEIRAMISGGLFVYANYVYQDSEYTNLDIGGTDLSGNELPLTPENSLTFGFDATRQVTGNVDLTLAADYQYKSETFLNPSNFTDATQEVDGLINASLSLASIASGLRVSIFVKNLTNEQFVTRANRLGVFLGNVDFSQGPPFAQVVAGSYSRPRTYGISLSYDF